VGDPRRFCEGGVEVAAATASTDTADTLNSSSSSHGAARGSAPADPGESTRPVVLAGGQALVRATRRSVLVRAGVNVVADVADAAAAAEAAEVHEAALVLLDSDVGGGCVSAVRSIAKRAPGTAVLVIAPELERERLLAERAALFAPWWWRSAVSRSSPEPA